MNNDDVGFLMSHFNPLIKWRRAWRALHGLLANPDDTAKAQDVFMAIGAADFERNFQRFTRSQLGRQLLQQRTSLADALSDRKSLEKLPEGSLGRCYLSYLDTNRFEALSLIELSRETQTRWEQNEGASPRDPDHSSFGDRMTLCHDLFHLVSGYGTDNVDEAALLAFSQPQLRGKANALLAFGAILKLSREYGVSWLLYAYQAWKRGRRARWLLGFPWEQTLLLPLATVRLLADIEPLATHPQFGTTHNAPLL